MRSSGRVYKARVPSNIALLKYWGKTDIARQIPANSSLSMTLSQAQTITQTSRCTDAEDQILYAGKLLASDSRFGRKVYQHLARIKSHCQYDGALRVATQNTFPDSCGIASSASGMAALTLSAIAAICDARNLEDLADHGWDGQALALFAKLGSGSAARSLFGGIVSWNVEPETKSESVVCEFNAKHWPLADIIIMVNQNQKMVSSSVGHEGAFSSPLFQTRLAGMAEKRQRIMAALAAQDWPEFGNVIEQEALEMHAVMMTAKPPICYLEDATLELLTWIRERRAELKQEMYFTLDAGPNIHLLCQPTQARSIAADIAQHFPQFELLIDQIGTGPQLACAEL